MPSFVVQKTAFRNVAGFGRRYRMKLILNYSR